MIGLKDSFIEKEFRELNYSLRDLADREATVLFRIARKAERKNCSSSLIHSIREEAWFLRDTIRAYPHRMLDGIYMEEHFKYAFNIGHLKEVGELW